MALEFHKLFSSSARSAILISLYWHVPRLGHFCGSEHCPGLGLRQLSTLTGLSLRSVQNAVKDLKTQRLIRVKRRGNRVEISLIRKGISFLVIQSVADAISCLNLELINSQIKFRGAEVIGFSDQTIRLLSSARGRSGSKR